MHVRTSHTPHTALCTWHTSVCNNTVLSVYTYSAGTGMSKKSTTPYILKRDKRRRRKSVRILCYKCMCRYIIDCQTGYAWRTGNQWTMQDAYSCTMLIAHSFFGHIFIGPVNPEACLLHLPTELLLAPSVSGEMTIVAIAVSTRSHKWIHILLWLLMKLLQATSLWAQLLKPSSMEQKAYIQLFRATCS